MTDEQKRMRQLLIDKLPEYSQTTHILRADDCFCISGVMCDLIDPNGWTRDSDDDFSFQGKWVYITPKEIGHAFGFADWEVAELRALNDAGYTFSKLVEIIKDMKEKE